LTGCYESDVVRFFPFLSSLPNRTRGRAQRGGVSYYRGATDQDVYLNGC